MPETDVEHFLRERLRELVGPINSGIDPGDGVCSYCLHKVGYIAPWEWGEIRPQTEHFSECPILLGRAALVVTRGEER
jgi:hypothetical protein